MGYRKGYVQMNIQIPEDLHRAVNLRRGDVPLSMFVRRALEDAVGAIAGPVASQAMRESFGRIKGTTKDTDEVEPEPAGINFAGCSHPQAKRQRLRSGQVVCTKCGAAL